MSRLVLFRAIVNVEARVGDATTGARQERLFFGAARAALHAVTAPMKPEVELATDFEDRRPPD